MSGDFEPWEQGPEDARKMVEQKYHWLEKTRWERIRTYIKVVLALAILTYIALRLMKVVH